MKKLILLFTVLNIAIVANAQIDFSPKNSFKVEIGLPNNASNYAFRQLMQGLVVITPSYQHTFDNTLTIGAGLRYSFFNVNEFKNNIDMTGGVHIAGAFAKIGQEKFYGNFGVDYGVRVGYASNVFATNTNDEANGGPRTSEGVFVEPTLGLSLMANEKTSFRLALGFAVHDFKFTPEDVSVESFSGISNDQLKNNTSYFTIGFGYSYYFGKN
ncbi:hypothetical protein [Brumimicrobium aurantiacum]|uniref:Outer membrane protein beta-barrel domain-containing protein n=1 Tax=Brumimicrobium aurantiacum TaxID=1737063 RepID=A0A3E1EVZ2_9FLAO|nr:hypothetical protein [Brumimicrobium aurantiacum]RFC53726.1 hypothetical protein DXU93_11405 [Brumimicrobium aurantiacum]